MESKMSQQPEDEEAIPDEIIDGPTLVVALEGFQPPVTEKEMAIYVGTEKAHANKEGESNE